MFSIAVFVFLFKLVVSIEVLGFSSPDYFEIRDGKCQCQFDIPDEFPPIVFDLDQGVGKSLLESKESCSMHLSDVQEFTTDYLNYSIESFGMDLDDDYSSETCGHVEDIIRDFSEECFPNDWKITGILGRGVSGKVYSTQGPDGKRGALKVQSKNNFVDVDMEIMMNKIFHRIGLSPEFKNSCRYEDVYVMHTGRIDMTLGEYMNEARTRSLYPKISEVIERMEQNGLRHGDFHSQNLGFIVNEGGKTATIKIIDLGLSRFGANPCDEIMAFVSIKPFPPLAFEFKNKMKEIYGCNFPNDRDELVKYRKMLSIYPVTDRVSEEVGVRFCKKFKEEYGNLNC